MKNAMNTAKTMNTTTNTREIMMAALKACAAQHGGQIPSGRTDVRLDGIQSALGVTAPLYVRVFGKSPIKTIVTVQFVADGKMYSADVGNKSGKLGRINSWEAT